MWQKGFLCRKFWVLLLGWFGSQVLLLSSNVVLVIVLPMYSGERNHLDLWVVISQMSTIGVGQWQMHLSTSSSAQGYLLPNRDQMLFTPNWHEKWHLSHNIKILIQWNPNLDFAFRVHSLKSLIFRNLQVLIWTIFRMLYHISYFPRIRIHIFPNLGVHISYIFVCFLLKINFSFDRYNVIK